MTSVTAVTIVTSQLPSRGVADGTSSPCDGLRASQRAGSVTGAAPNCRRHTEDVVMEDVYTGDLTTSWEVG